MSVQSADRCFGPCGREWLLLLLRRGFNGGCAYGVYETDVHAGRLKSDCSTRGKLLTAASRGMLFRLLDGIRTVDISGEVYLSY